MVTFKVDGGYANAKKQFVARILGRDPKLTFNREFVGSRGGKRDEVTTADVDTPGLYELRSFDRKDRKVDHYILLIEFEGRLEEYAAEKADAMRVAKELDAGKAFADIVHGGKESWDFWTARAKAAATTDQAAAACWDLLKGLPPAEVKKALAALRKLATPAAPPQVKPVAAAPAVPAVEPPAEPPAADEAA